MNIQIRFLNPEYFFNLIYQFLTSSRWSGTWPETLSDAVFWIKLFSLLVTPVFFVIILILSIKISKLRTLETAAMKTSLLAGLQVAPIKNERWEAVLTHLASDNPAEWKLAVIEADNMLDDLVKRLKTVGDNLGERLKSIEPSDFLTLDEAWEAHRMRNRIAHEAGMTITKPEARQTIERYKRVFEEFEYI